MKKHFSILAGTILVLGFCSLALVGASKNAAPPVRFAVANVRFEQNATDGDVEVVFEAKGRAEGLAKFTVVSPDGRTVVDFTAPDAATTLGMRQFRFESPEPKLDGKATLSHQLPAVTAFVNPKPEAQGMAFKNLEITWAPVKDIAAYHFYIEQNELGVELTAKLPGSVTSFAVPNGFLQPGTEYVLGLGTMTKDGNTSYIETSFQTAAKE